MSVDEIISALKQYKQDHQKEYGIKSLGIFGSVSKGEISKNSDLDIFVELEKPDLFLLADIKQDIEQDLNIPVDIVRMRENMNPLLQKIIARDGIYV
ncbi:MAG TPA: nucleotidyltransferase [Phycisphaerales bacterium]|nr:nucleotidyltransferase [Phycisphaerales bacterium]